MSKAVPNGALSSPTTAARAARRSIGWSELRREPIASKSFRTFRTEYGYGFALVGSVLEREIVTKGTEDGFPVSEVSGVQS